MNPTTQLFESKEEVQELVGRADHSGVTRRLISHLRNLKEERESFYLQLDELEKILEWKLRGQFGRQKEKRKANTNGNVIAITKAAFAVSHTDEDIETKLKLKLKLLIALSGVEVPVASAILTLCYPEQYSVIDFRNWRQVYHTRIQKTNYTTNEYVEYLKVIKFWAEKFEVIPQEIDLAIWQKDIESKK